MNTDHIGEWMYRGYAARNYRQTLFHQVQTKINDIFYCRCGRRWEMQTAAKSMNSLNFQQDMPPIDMIAKNCRP